MRKENLRFDLVLASPAARVRETIDGVQEEFDFAAPIRFERAMYLASDELIMGLLQSLQESVHSLLLIGHNPGLQNLLLHLSGRGDHRLRQRIASKFPTAALAIVELGIERWDEIESGNGRLAKLIVPNEL
jgi:phosphohistidine phosphatase